MGDRLSHYHRNRYQVWANCDTAECAHGAPLDLETLIDHPKVGDISLQHLKALNILRCRVCGERKVHLNIQPPLRR